MNNITKSVILSLKPCYADLVFEGLKRAELRRRITPNMENCNAFIYVSSPVRQLRGGFRIERVWSGSPADIWNEVSELAHVKKQEFDDYYAGRTIAYALKITDVWIYQNSVGLDELRNRIPNFVVPQSWRYVKPEEYQFFQNMKLQNKATQDFSETTYEREVFVKSGV